MAHLGDIELLTKFPLKESLGNPRRGGPSNSLGAQMGWGGGAPPPNAQRQHETHYLAGGAMAAVPSVPVESLLRVFRDRPAAALSDSPGDIVVRHARQMLATVQQDKHGNYSPVNFKEFISHVFRLCRLQGEYYNCPIQIFLKFSELPDSGTERYPSPKFAAEIYFYYLKNYVQF